MNSFRLQSNPTSTFAYSQLNKTQALLNKNIQRLSSGLRINSAADDTAGSAMATRMTNQIRGMHQANRNSRDANNLLATTEAGLNNIGDLLAQMRELS
ncbi:flagellin FliC, partial [Candidatus Poribacteria bacterium]|nr:flagellin FliC [Candidatus Poribacteria bacterium]